jgi:hypothetical protein
MRPFLFLMPLLLWAASTTGCGSKVPAGSHPPLGVIENPVRPDPEAIQQRKRMLIAPRNRVVPTRSEGKR